MYPFQIAAGVLFVATVLLYSSKTAAEEVSVSTSGTTVHDSKQQGQDEQPMFYYGHIVTLSKANGDSSGKPREERCRKIEDTLRFIIKRTRPGLVGASSVDVYRAAIETLKNRALVVSDHQPLLITLKDCVESLQSVDGATAASDADAHPQKGASGPFESPTARHEDPIAEFRSAEKRLGHADRDLIDESRTQSTDTTDSSDGLVGDRDSLSTTVGADYDAGSRGSDRHLESQPQHAQGASSIDNHNKQQQQDSDFQSMLAQSQQTQEKLMRQHSSDEERLRQLEDDLAREKNVSLERAKIIDELQQKVSLEASKGALIRIKLESEYMKQDIANLFVEYDDIIARGLFPPSNYETRPPEIIALIHKRANTFQKVLEAESDIVSNTIDKLRAKERQANHRYGLIKGALNRLKFEFKQLRQYLADQLSPSGGFILRRFYFSQNINKRTKQFNAVVREQLATALDNIAC